MGGTPKPSLVKSTALSKAQSVFSRINALLPSYSTPISPVTVYQPLPVGWNIADSNLGNQLDEGPTGTAMWGVWVAPNLFNGADYEVVVETFAGGGGGGGGSAAAPTPAGGGGGAGGEYALEPTYTVTPGLPYIWIVGQGGYGGSANSTSATFAAAGDGGDTIFDLAGTGLPGGVHAHGGVGGDIAGVGVGGNGQTGTSGNTVHFAGGSGGGNSAGVASDNPSTFIAASALWTEPSGGAKTIPTWLLMDDAAGNTTLNNYPQNTTGSNASIQNFTGGLVLGGSTAAPVQAPTQTLGPIDGMNVTNYGGCAQFKRGNAAQASARISCQSFPYTGSYIMMSGWIQADPHGVWGNVTPGYNATLAANCNYVASSGNNAGAALYFNVTGSTSNPVWNLTWHCANGSASHSISTTTVTPVPGTWYYIVAVFNAGTMTLYVNNVSVQSGAAGFTTIPGGAYPMSLGLRPDSTNGYFFGYMSNFWFANAVPATTLIADAYGGVTPATGGAGGGATGDSSGAGGAGAGAIGTAAGQGGAPVAFPVGGPYVDLTTPGITGGTGGTAHNSAPAPTVAAGYGGGGSGSSVSTVALTTLTENITTAATYNGIDGSQPGSLYNPNQQGTQGTLVAGGQASDPVTGSKNSILLLPPGLAKTLAGKTIVDCYLTVYNANPSNTINPVLEISYSADTGLPATYEGSVAYTAGITAAVPYILQGTTAAQQISLMNSGNGVAASFTAALKTGAATAIVLGPGGTAAASPSFDAYNAPAANYFFASIYGPGATNSFGQSVAPTLTIVYAPSGTPQQGQIGGNGQIFVTLATDEGFPIVSIQPYQTTDTAGNVLAQGITVLATTQNDTQELIPSGGITAFAPGGTPGTYVPETWHSVFTFSTGWGSASGYPVGYRLLPTGDIQLCGRIEANTNVLPSTTAMFTLPSSYVSLLSAMSSSNNFRVPASVISSPANGSPSWDSVGINLNGSGVVGLAGGTFTPTNGNTISLDGIIFPVSSLIPSYPVL